MSLLKKLLFAGQTAVMATALVMPVKAAEVDIFIPPGGLWVDTSQHVEGQSVRIYAYAKTTELADTYGSIIFFVQGQQIGSPQPISIVNGVSDSVFMNWIPAFGGFIDLSVKVTLVIDDESDSSNNTQRLLDVFVDYDTDGDSVGNQQDIDDDNDGVLDTQDSFPLDGTRSSNTDEGSQTNQNFQNNQQSENGQTGNSSDSTPSLPLEGEGTTSSNSSGNGTEQSESGASSQTSQTTQTGQTGQANQTGQQGQQNPTNQTSQTNQTGQRVQPSTASGSASPTQGGRTSTSASLNSITDTDSDSVIDSQDVFPTNAEESTDTDSDGLGNNTDLDDDNDELSDIVESRVGTNPLVANTPQEVQSVFDELGQEVLGLRETAEQSGERNIPYGKLSILLLSLSIAGMAVYKRRELSHHLKQWTRKK